MGQGLSTEVGDRALHFETVQELRALKERVLSNDETLSTLDLSNRYVGVDGIAEGADALANNTSIRELNLSYNRITDQAIGVLCEALSRNRTLEVLILSGNPLTEEGTHFLAALLRANDILHTIVLYNCDLTDQAAVPLANGLLLNNSLCCLNLSLNRLTDAGVDLLTRCLERNKALAEVDLSHNAASDAAVNALRARLAEQQETHERLAAERSRRHEEARRRREAEQERRREEEERRLQERRCVEAQKVDMEARQRMLRADEEALQRMQRDEVTTRREQVSSGLSHQQQYIEAAITNSYMWRDKIQSGGGRSWESGFTRKANPNAHPNADAYGMTRTLTPCWCEPTDAPAGYSGQLHYHCRYEKEPDTFHSSEGESRKYEGCKRTGHPCISVGTYAKPLQKDTAATFFSSRSPHLPE